MFLIVCIFLRNRVLILRQKYPLANFRVKLFSCLSSERSWWISPSINSTFPSFKTWTVPPIASWQCTTNDWGYVLSSEPQTLRQALTSSMSFYKHQSAIGGEKEKQMLVFVQREKYTCKFISPLLHNFTFTLMWNYFFTLNSIWRYLVAERVTVALPFYPTIRTRVYYSQHCPSACQAYWNSISDGTTNFSKFCFLRSGTQNFPLHIAEAP